MLGDIISRFGDETGAEAALLEIGDLHLLTAVRSAAAQQGESSGVYMTRLIGRFTAGAGPDAWMALMTAANRADNPGAACLRHILESASDA